jgi:hypothetical protein
MSMFLPIFRPWNLPISVNTPKEIRLQVHVIEAIGEVVKTGSQLQNAEVPSPVDDLIPVRLDLLGCSIL